MLIYYRSLVSFFLHWKVLLHSIYLFSYLKLLTQLLAENNFTSDDHNTLCLTLKN